MIAEGSPPLRRRRLAAELRRLREDADLNGVQVAKALRWSTSKISRIETGQIVPSEKDIAKLLKHYQVRSEYQDLLLELARSDGPRSWWDAYADVITDQIMELVGFESGAQRIRAWQAMLIPGLLQTYDYATAVGSLYSHLEVLPPGKIERRAKFRLRRQERLTSGELDFAIVLDEAILLRRFTDEDVMRDQLRRLIELGDLPNVSLRVLRLAERHPTDVSNFMLLGFPEVEGLGPLYGDVVYTENYPSSDLAEDEDTAYRYAVVFQQLLDVALRPEESRALIASLAGM